MQDPLSWLYLISIFLLLTLAFLFSLVETSFTALNLFKMRVKADEGNKRAKLVVKIYSKYERTLITSLLGYNIVSILSSILGTLLFLLFLGHTKFSNELISLFATIAITLLFYLFGDIIPKFIAKAIPNRVSLTMCYFAYGSMIVFYPFVFLFESILWLFYKVFRLKERPTITRDDFTNIVDSIEEEGLIEETESDIIHASFAFVDTSVKEVLTPIEKMFAINLDSLTHKKLHALILSSTYSRIPIYQKELNNIVGILHVKSYLNAYFKNPETLIIKTLQKPYFVSTEIKMDEMFEGFKKHHTHIAIVLSPSKKVLGMVTMEDVLEELVGEIHEIDPHLKGETK